MNKKRNLEIKDFKIIEKPITNFDINKARLYFVASDEFWHNGAHFTIYEDKINDGIKNIYDGKIIACRYSSGYQAKDVNFDKFTISEQMLEDYFYLYPGNFFIYNFFDYEDGVYKLKEEYKTDDENNKKIIELIKRELGIAYSNSFILIEHNAEKSILLKDDKTDKINYQFYTLYNHLRPLNNYLNKEKKDLFFYNAEIKLNNIFPYTFVKGYSTVDKLKSDSNDYIEVCSETQIEETDYYKYILNGETNYIYLDESYVRNFISHIETRRPAFTKNELSDTEYLTSGYKTDYDKLFLFDVIDKNNRCVTGILTENDIVTINYNDFITFLSDTNNDHGVKTSKGFIFFDSSVKNKLIEGLKAVNLWNVSNSPIIRYNIKYGFSTERYLPTGIKENLYIKHNDKIIIPPVLSHYILASKLKSNTDYSFDYLWIPCELKLEKTSWTSTNFKKVAYVFNDEIKKCFISVDNIREIKKKIETKRKLRPYEALDGRNSSDFIARGSRNVVSNILIYDTDDISNRYVKAEVPKSTVFKVNKETFNTFISNLTETSFNKGIYVEYEFNKQKDSGYIYIPWGYNLSNIESLADSNLEKLKEKIKETSTKIDAWFNTLNQAENISFDEFQITLKKDEKIKEDQIYTPQPNDLICNLSKGDIIGHGGYMAETPDETKELRKFENFIHFETFCKNDDFMKFDKNRIDYKADFLIKSETYIHKINPVTETIIKPLDIIQLNYNFRNALENTKANEIAKFNTTVNNIIKPIINVRKNLFSDSLFKPKFVQIEELSNETLDMVYFKKTGKEISLIEGETFVELETQGTLVTLDDNEYIKRSDFGVITYVKPIYTIDKDYTFYTYKKNENKIEKTNKKITLYKNFKYTYVSEKGDFRIIKYYYVPLQKHESFYISQKVFNERFILINDSDTYMLSENQKLLQSEIFEEPKNLIWSEPAESLQSGTYENTHKEITDKDKKTWVLAKKENSSSKIWINKEDISNQIDTEKPVEEIIYDKWEDFFEEIDLTSFGQYRCEKESDLLSTLNLIKENKDDKLKYLLNQNQETVSSLYFKKESEWDDSSKLFDEQKKVWKYSDQDFLQKQHDDYCFWNETNLDKKVTFFHPVKFLSLMDKVIDVHAAELLRVQTNLLKLKCLLKGGVGHRGDNKGKNWDSEQTWCNVAVFLTIRALDSNYTDFVIDPWEYPWWQKDYETKIPWKKFKDEYINYRPSNFWCDVLDYKAHIDTASPIEEIDYIKAQKLANQGKVVIAAWKNPKKTANASPHYVTLSPNNFTNDLFKIKVANVGIENGEKKLFEAFSDNECKNVKFYYNTNQNHICDLDAGKDKWFPSINELKEKYGEI